MKNNAKETTNVTIRIDKDLKYKAEILFDEFGLTLSSAINMFIKQAVREQEIPFKVRRLVPNKETLEAIKESYNDNSSKIYENANEMFKDILGDVQD